LLIGWHGVPAPVAVSRRRFCGAAAAVWVIGAGSLAGLAGGVAAIVVRALIVAAVGLLVGAAIAPRRAVACAPASG
jgi:hypothetical protein